MIKLRPISYLRPASTMGLAKQLIYPTCSLEQLVATARCVLGDQLCGQNNAFFARTNTLAKAFEKKAGLAGKRFRPSSFFAAAALAIRAHVHEDGTPMTRLSGKLDVYHLLGVLERLTKSDVPYLGQQAYSAAWLHDTIEENPGLPIDAIGQAFGQRAAAIVNAMTNLKTSKQETRLQQADRYEPAFIRSVIELTEVLYIKMADLNDYFETCQMKPPESIFLHYSFIDQVIFPLASTIVGAREMAVALANKALKIARPNDDERLTRQIEGFVSWPGYQDMAETINSILKENFLAAKTSIYFLSPYELLVKERTGKKRLQNEVDRLNSLPENYPDTEEGLRLSAQYRFSPREFAFIRLETASPADCYKVRTALEQSLGLSTERHRDFIAAPKANRYRALHEETNTQPHYRVQIFSAEMADVNRLGLAASWTRRTKNKPLVTPLLSESVLETIQRTDREGRRFLMLKLPNLRQVEVEAVFAAPIPEIRVHRPLVDQVSNWLELAGACDPHYPLRLVCGQWNDQTFSGYQLAKGFPWFNEQKASLILSADFIGHDFYSSIHDPQLLRQLTSFIKNLPPAAQAALGKKMIGFALYSAIARGYKTIPLANFNLALAQDSTFSDNYLNNVVFEFEELFKMHWLTPDDFYRKIAVGRYAVPLVASRLVVNQYELQP